MCTQPKTAWQKKFTSLTDSSHKYYADKKLKFKQPPDWWNYNIININCGNCEQCLLSHANHWATRIYMEAKLHKKNCFVTLTYDNEHLPIEKNHMTLRQKDMQDFIKRLRYHIKEKISYFYCGEYGPKTHRPHYHLIILGWQPDDLKLSGFSKTDQQMFNSDKLAKIWGNGFVNIQELNYKTACYTSRYCTKKAGIQKTKREYTGEFVPVEKIDERNGKKFIQNKNLIKTIRFDKFGREKEFIQMSKKPAIGLRYWTENKDKILRNNGIMININGQVIIKPVPRYFKKIFEKENLDKFLAWNHNLKKTIEQNKNNQIKKISSQKEYLDEKILVDNLEKRLNEMNDKNIKFKANLLKRSQI